MIAAPGICWVDLELEGPSRLLSHAIGKSESPGVVNPWFKFGWGRLSEVGRIERADFATFQAKWRDRAKHATWMIHHVRGT